MADGQESRSHSGRFSDARSEFVSSLTRRLDTVRQALRLLESEPSDRDRRDNLLRRLHAIGASAKVLGFASAAEVAATAEERVHASGQGPVSGEALREVARALDVLPGLVKGPRSSSRPPGMESNEPLGILVYGDEELAKAFAEEDGVPLDVTRCDRWEDAVERTQSWAPDVAVVDVDQPQAEMLLERLHSGTENGPLPIVVVGHLHKPEQASHYLGLGASRIVSRPFGAAMLRRTVVEMRQGSHSQAVVEPIGEVTVGQLAERIIGEVRRGLVDATDPEGRELPVPLGNGSEILAATWAAVARIRQLVSLQSRGGVQFTLEGPEGAIPVVASPVQREAGERGGSGARQTDPQALRGRKVLIADDDPAIVWFLSDLLKAVGAQVLEAHDGRAALELAYSKWPDLIVSDVLMPKLDGFTLCRHIKRDVALRDTPVILLSWKEDLLQRLRELGADADGYLQKEAAASMVVERALEVLRPRTRVEERLEAGVEVSGRLDGLTPRLVLQLVAALQKDACVTVRDAAYVYEAQVRDAELRCVSRVGDTGESVQGPRALSALLGVSAGRFSVAPDASECDAQFSGSIEELLSTPVSEARWALRGVAAEVLIQVERLKLDTAQLGDYLQVTPEPAQGLLRRLMEGASPRKLLLEGAASPRLLEAVLSDVARRGAVVEIEPAPPEPLPSSATGERKFSFALTPEPPRASATEAEGGPPSRPSSRPDTATKAPREPAEPEEADLRTSVPAVLPLAHAGEADRAPAEEEERAAEKHLEEASAEDKPERTLDLGEVIAGLAEDQTPQPIPAKPTRGRAIAPATPDKKPLFGEPATKPGLGVPAKSTSWPKLQYRAAERPFVSAAPAADEPSPPAQPSSRLADEPAASEPPRAQPSSKLADEPAASEPPPAQPSSRPVAEPAASEPPRAQSSSRLPDELAAEEPLAPALAAERFVAQPAQRDGAEAEPAARERVEERPLPGSASAQEEAAPEPAKRDDPLAEMAVSQDVPRVRESVQRLESQPKHDASRRSASAGDRGSGACADEGLPAPTRPERASPEDRASELDTPSPPVVDAVPPKKTGQWKRDAVGFAAAAIVGFLAVRGLFGTAGPSEEPAAASEAPLQAAEDSVLPGSEEQAKREASTQNGDLVATTAALPEGAELPPGTGLLELATDDKHSIYVDGEFIGRGPLRRAYLPPGSHEVRLRLNGEEQAYTVQVEVGKQTQLAAAR